MEYIIYRSWKLGIVRMLLKNTIVQYRALRVGYYWYWRCMSVILRVTGTNSTTCTCNCMKIAGMHVSFLLGTRTLVVSQEEGKTEGHIPRIHLCLRRQKRLIFHRLWWLPLAYTGRNCTQYQTWSRKSIAIINCNSAVFTDTDIGRSVYHSLQYIIRQFYYDIVIRIHRASILGFTTVVRNWAPVCI